MSLIRIVHAQLTECFPPMWSITVPELEMSQPERRIPAFSGFSSLRTHDSSPAPSSVSVCPRCRSASLSTMRAKRSGRRHRRPNSDSAPVTTHSTSQRRPARIKVDSTTLSLREQLQLVKSKSEQSSPRVSPVRTSYRRQKADSIPFHARRRTSDGDDSVPDGKYNVEEAPILFIDGYNIIGRWARLRKHRNRGDMETARQKLIHDVSEFSHLRGWSCVVVFDAHGNDNALNVSTTSQLIDVVFTGNSTADSYIERAVFSECERGLRQVWCATSDLSEGRFSAAKGAHIWSASLFIHELKSAKRESREIFDGDEKGNGVRAQMLISNVDQDTAKALYNLREALDKR